MYNSQQTAERIKLLAKERNVSISKLLIDCSLNKNALYTMQSSGYYPRVEAILKIADYLDCSVDYLLGRTEFIKHTDCSAPLSNKEQYVIDIFKSLNNQGQEYILQTLDLVKDQYKKVNTVSNMENTAG